MNDVYAINSPGEFKISHATPPRLHIGSFSHIDNDEKAHLCCFNGHAQY